MKIRIAFILFLLLKGFKTIVSNKNLLKLPFQILFIRSVYELRPSYGEVYNKCNERILHSLHVKEKLRLWFQVFIKFHPQACHSVCSPLPHLHNFNLSFYGKDLVILHDLLGALLQSFRFVSSPSPPLLSSPLPSTPFPSLSSQLTQRLDMPLLPQCSCASELQSEAQVSGQITSHTVGSFSSAQLQHVLFA